MIFYTNKLTNVFVIVSLILLANAQKTPSSLRDVDIQELARQNQITTKILEAFIQKKLGLASTNVKAPSIFDILPAKKPEERLTRESIGERLSKRHRKEPLVTENTEGLAEDTDAAAVDAETLQHDTEESPDYVDILPGEIPEAQEPENNDNLQSVETEHIDSIYTEGRSKKYATPPAPFENELEPSRDRKRFNFCDCHGIIIDNRL